MGHSSRMKSWANIWPPIHKDFRRPPGESFEGWVRPCCWGIFWGVEVGGFEIGLKWWIFLGGFGFIDFFGGGICGLFSPSVFLEVWRFFFWGWWHFNIPERSLTFINYWCIYHCDPLLLCCKQIQTNHACRHGNHERLREGRTLHLRTVNFIHNPLELHSCWCFMMWMVETIWPLTFGKNLGPCFVFACSAPDAND